MKAKVTQGFVNTVEACPKAFDVLDTNLLGFLLRVEPTGRKVFYVRCRKRDGKISRIRIGPTDALSVAQARDKARELLAAIALGEDPIGDKHAAKAHTIGSFIEGEYAETILSHMRSGPATLKRLHACFSEYWGRSLNDPTLGRAVQNWRSKRLKAGRAPSTVNRDITALRGVLSHAIRIGHIETHPLSKVRSEKVDTQAKVRYLTDEEEVRLMAALYRREERLRAERDSHNRWLRARGHTLRPDLRTVPFSDFVQPLVLLPLNSGLRRGELFSLEWDDVDLSRGMLTVQGKTAKSGKTRHVELNSAIRNTFRTWKKQMASAGLVFPSPRGGDRLDNINHTWSALMRDAKIVNLRFHDLRHTFASRLVMCDISLAVVRELLGHSSILTTQKYAHLAPKKRQDAVETLVPTANVVPFAQGVQEKS
jgi:integrase